MTNVDGLKEAISVAGSSHKLARSLGISAQAIWEWKKPGREIPPPRVIEIERITGVSRSKLRPDLWPREGDAA